MVDSKFMVKREYGNRIPYGYPVNFGYRGYVPGEGFMLFATEEEYEDYIEIEKKYSEKEE